MRSLLLLLLTILFLSGCSPTTEVIAVQDEGPQGGLYEYIIVSGYSKNPEKLRDFMMRYNQEHPFSLERRAVRRYFLRKGLLFPVEDKFKQFENGHIPVSNDLEDLDSEISDYIVSKYMYNPEFNIVTYKIRADDLIVFDWQEESQTWIKDVY